MVAWVCRFHLRGDPFRVLQGIGELELRSNRPRMVIARNFAFFDTAFLSLDPVCLASDELCVHPLRLLLIQLRERMVELRIQYRRHSEVWLRWHSWCLELKINLKCSPGKSTRRYRIAASSDSLPSSRFPRWSGMIVLPQALARLSSWEGS